MSAALHWSDFLCECKKKKNEMKILGLNFTSSCCFSLLLQPPPPQPIYPTIPLTNQHHSSRRIFNEPSPARPMSPANPNVNPIATASAVNESMPVPVQTGQRVAMQAWSSARPVAEFFDVTKFSPVSHFYSNCC
jgi:hypothetical protein